jgi:hypothetical protein
LFEGLLNEKGGRRVLLYNPYERENIEIGFIKIILFC